MINSMPVHETKPNHIIEYLQGIYRKTDIHKFKISLGTQGLWEMKIIKDLNRRNNRRSNVSLYMINCQVN